MKKIGIVTLNGNFNYGNRLQNFALQKTLNDMGFYSSTIIVKEKKVFYFSLTRLKRKIKKILNQDSEIILWEKMCLEKERVFLPFTNKYLSNSEFDQTKRINDNFDFFIVGSDQVWNPNIINKNNFFLLNFADSKKKISYAASFGINQLPEKYKNFFRKELSTFKDVSVREYEGAKIINELSGDDVDVVPDPTLLLPKQLWHELVKNEKIPDKKYIFIYFLRKINEKKINEIYEFAKNNNYEVFHVMGDSFQKEYQVPSPLQFVKCIENAEMVFTDSFHGSVFSMIFETPFIVYERTSGNMSSRIENLIMNFQLKGNKYQEGINFSNIQKNTNFLYSKQKLILEREKGINFLSKALNA